MHQGDDMAQSLRHAALTILVLALSACGGGGGGSAPPPVSTPADTLAPVITITGADTVNHEQGTTYTDAGATANDNVDGTVTVTTSGSVGSAAGTYTLEYSATDRAGNTATASRTVIVADTTPPAITLNGDRNVTHPEGTAWVDPGATATDTVDGAVTPQASGTVGAAPGVYTLTYTATDAAGNVATATRTVTVEASGTGGGDTIVYDEGAVGPVWTKGINAFDAALNFGECNNDGGAGCPSIGWAVVDDAERGDVLEITHAASGDFAGLFIAADGVVDLSDYDAGSLVFDVKVVSGDSKITMKLDCIFPCTSGDQALGSKGAGGWETVDVPLSVLANGGLNLGRVNTGIVIWATDTTSTVFRIDNVRFTGIADGATPPTGPTDPGAPTGFNIIPYGAGSVSDTVNPQSYRCVFDFGNFIYNAGVVRPAIDGCDTSTGTPSGTPTPLLPQLTGPAEQAPTATHRWWGSIAFLGEMRIGDPSTAGYITPDPITARISERGARIMGIPAGLTTVADGFLYQIPDPFAEVFDGIAVGNTLFADLDAYLKDHSDGSVTVEWQSGGQPVMEATFVHGSPYAYFTASQGELVLRTLRADGGEKGTFYNQGDSLGIWTSVAGNYNNFLVTGEGTTTFSDVTASEIVVSNAANALTLTLLPQLDTAPATALTTFFETYARNVVASVDIDYAVDRSSNEVTVSHAYRDAAGAPVQTIAGLHPLHWKRSPQATTSYQVRSARGTIRFAQTDGFSYALPYVGVLPTLPTIPGTFDQATLSNLVVEFVAPGPSTWNDRTDTYFAGKNYGKVAELIAITRTAGLTAESNQLLDWLKAELADWFTADSNGTLDVFKYFVYDDDWNTVLGLEEAFASHQQLNDHHFHYGYFIRAAAEICRVDPAWCGADQYGPMIELLIRDYAGGRGDAMFPYVRHFDPANGFSWASGMVNFVRGNNNESTSEAANAYGAIVLYGLATGNDALVERGMYLHASTAAAYWEYWNNLDGYNNAGADADNFPAAYDKIATSIIWGDGAVFSTFFSAAFAQILGIQGLPSNPLILHVGLYPDYLQDYVALGLSESSNGRPSGLQAGQWPDIWWAIWSLTDPAAAISDYNSVASYTPEDGETRAHTYHWINTLANLGRVRTGTGALTADYPAALAFDNNGVTTYVVYNFGAQALRVTYSDGQIVDAAPLGFTLMTR
jgi:endoglucanase Acf2